MILQIPITTLIVYFGCGKGAEHVEKKGTASIGHPSVEQEGSDDERGPRDVAK